MMRPGVFFGRPMFVIDATHIDPADLTEIGPGTIIRCNPNAFHRIDGNVDEQIADLEQLLAGM